eukprot:TRINITY_DN9124_c0_g1_i1.p1 TRINITY_DN9124_c0_g1~~TRINITY_DN9124_c0_g1_i1.p1  ORF type:complete len:1049 (-),score=416.15 TRINITY_DN9124_c0_g1_i1:332-3478(-)
MGVKQNFTVSGSIVKITMQNFMTYKHETFWPGPNFNVTVGPNGSGKSSIVTALCIGLGGDLSSLNRQSDLASLVNNDAKSGEAMVEIELFMAEEKNKIVSVYLYNNGNVPFWKVNGEKISKKDLKALTEELQIQPGNMCQFLPQDVVRDFPTMSSQQIFYNTVKAVGDTVLIDTYDRLKEIQIEVEHLEDQAETKETTLANLERKEKKLESDRQIFEKRKTLEDRNTEIENAIKWEKFKTLRKQVKETRDKERSLKGKIDGMEVKQAPIRVFLDTYKSKVATMKEQIEQADREYSACCTKVEEFDIADLEDQLDRLVEQERDLTQQEHSRLQNKNRIEREITELRHHLANHQLDPETDSKITELSSKRSKHENAAQRNEQSMNEIDFHHSTLKREVEKLERAEAQLQDKKNRKLQTLQRENPDAFNGVMWLRDNRNMFRAPVHDPIMLTLDVKDRNFARYVESHIGRADLEGFVCEDPDDVNLLTKQLRENLRLRKINAFHSSPDPPDSFAHPYSKEEMSKYAFMEYISDMYSAPDAVHAYLCRQKALHQVPVFREENNNSAQLKHKFHNYYIANQKFNTRKSKYSGELSTGMEDIGSRKVIRLAATVDRQEVDRIVAELEQKRKQLKINATRQETMARTCENIKAEISKLNVQIGELRAAKKDFSSKQSELAMKERTLEQLKEPKFDLNSEKEKIREEKRKVVKQLSEQMFKMRNLTEDSVKKENERRTLHLAFQNIESENSENKERLAGLDRELEAARAEHTEITVLWDRDKRALQEKHSEARKATGILSDDVKYKPPEEWQKKFDKLGSSDENVLAALLDECESELKHTKKIPDKTIEDIEAMKEKLTQAREEKEQMERDMANKTHEAAKLRRKWINGVESLVENINDRFGAMMAELGYAGQISLSQGKREIDFSSYGVKIQVRFRVGHELQDLSKGTQSGGEKSVTTAVYMMALQELTQVPFRCVDEINQGMDERNERAIWAQLLKVCKEHQAQYFYMAPKFPYSLPFNEQVTMLICNNGNVDKEGHKMFRTKQFVEAAKKMKR